MGYPFVPKVLYGLPICSQGSSRVTRLFSKFSESYKLIVASQCLTLPIIANVKFHWTFPKMRRAGGVADGPRVLCRSCSSAMATIACTHRLLDSSSWTHPRKTLVSCNDCVLFQLPRDLQRFSGKKKKKRIEFLCWNSSSGVILLAHCVCAISFCSFSSMPLSKSPKASDLNSVSLTQKSLSLSLSLGFCNFHWGVFVWFFSFSSNWLRNLLFSFLPRSQEFFLLCSCCCLVYLLGTISCSFWGWPGEDIMTLWKLSRGGGGGSERQRQRLQLHGFHSASRLCHSSCWKKLPLVKLSCYEVFCFVLFCLVFLFFLDLHLQI